jgi:IPT/TIG domain
MTNPDPPVLPDGYQPPLVAGGLFVDPNWTPRLADRLGSVRTNLGGVMEHWPQDLAPVMYPHLPNGFWREVPAEALSLTSISPGNGPMAGGTPLTLTGTGFVDIVAINWEITSYSPADFVVVDSEHITCLSPTGAPGPGSIDVEVVNAADDVGRLLNGFTYDAPPPPAPTISTVVPNTGLTAGGDDLVITGTNFAPGMTAAVGGAPIASDGYVNPMRFEGASPPGTAGVVDVTVTTAGGTGTLTGGFTYTDTSDDPVVLPQSSEPSDVGAVAQTIQDNAQAIGEAAQNIGEAAQSLTEPSGTDPAPGTTSEAPSASTGTTEAPPSGQEPDMTEYEMDQYWGIEPAQGSQSAPAASG